MASVTRQNADHNHQAVTLLRAERDEAEDVYVQLIAEGAGRESLATAMRRFAELTTALDEELCQAAMTAGGESNEFAQAGLVASSRDHPGWGQSITS